MKSRNASERIEGCTPAPANVNELKERGFIYGFQFLCSRVSCGKVRCSTVRLPLLQLLNCGCWLLSGGTGCRFSDMPLPCWEREREAVDEEDKLGGI